MSVTPVPVGDPRRRQRRQLLGLAVLFFAPVAAAFLLYYGHLGWRPPGRVNRGDLIDPPRPLPAAALEQFGGGRTAPDWWRGKWTLLYLGPGNCPARCRQLLYETRQVRTALDRDMDRVQRVFLAADPCCDAEFLRREHTDLITVRADSAAAEVLAVLPAFGGLPPAVAERIYVIDPLGNLMMSYAPDAPPKGLLEDMKRLLKLSHVG